MNTDQLIQTLKIASTSQDNIAMRFLLVDAGLKLQQLDKLVKDMKFQMRYIQEQTHIGHIHDTASSFMEKIAQIED